jgi:hypothetical protein
MNEARTLWAKAVGLQLKQSCIERGEQTTFHTSHPSRKWLDWNPNKGFCRKRIDPVLISHRRHAESPYLITKDTPDAMKQPCLLNGLATIAIPTVDPHRHHRKVRKID